MSHHNRSETERPIGRRNPKTLPGVYSDSESYEQNRVRSRFWRSLGKAVRNGGSTGWKYG